MNHIFNISKIKSLMIDPPKAQRLEDMLNKDEFEGMTKDQLMDVVYILRTETDKIIKNIILKNPQV